MKHKESSETLKQLKRGIDKGYCRICNRYETLSEDHFPPKCCGNKGKVWIHSLENETIHHQNGATFKTLCNKCNNELGLKYDTDFGKLVNTLNADATIRTSGISRISVNTNNLLKCLTGHLLALLFLTPDIKSELQTPVNENNCFIKSLRDYYFDKNELRDYKIYYWYYNGSNNKLITLASTTYQNSQFINIGHIIKFKPIAFWFVINEGAWHELKIATINQSQPSNNLQFDFDIIPYEDFPEKPIKNEKTFFTNNRYYLLANDKSKIKKF